MLVSLTQHALAEKPKPFVGHLEPFTKGLVDWHLVALAEVVGAPLDDALRRTFHQYQVLALLLRCMRDCDGPLVDAIEWDLVQRWEREPKQPNRHQRIHIPQQGCL